MSRKLGFIGFGNMGGAILKGILEKSAMPADCVAVCDTDVRAADRARELGVKIMEGAPELCRWADMVFLCVKPNTVEKVLEECGVLLENKALLSIVAGASVERLKKLTSVSCRVLRIMPNTPAMVGEGAAVFASNTNFTEEEKKFSQEIFETIGLVEWLPETQIDVVTGLSGGGPAYVAMFIEAMADGAVLKGLQREAAYRLASQTVLGTAKMLLENKEHPGRVKDAVCSPGGTTIEGVKALEDGGMRAAVINAVIKSAEKSAKL